MEREKIIFTEILDYVNKRSKSAERFDSNTRILFLRNLTIEGIEPFIKYHHYNSSINVSCSYGNYDNVKQELLDPSALIYSYNPEIIVLSLYQDNFIRNSGDTIQSENIISELEHLFNLAQTQTKSLLVVNTFIPPFVSEEGISGTGSRINEIEKVNCFIRDYVIKNNSRIFLADWERYIRILGEDESIDYRFWYMSKSPFKNSFLDLYAKDISKVSIALKGKSKKCLLLDCDNTLWGGIIGEDGIDGIKLDNDSYPGKIFYEFQQNILKLYERGILICICSKNNEDDVFEVLDKHPYSLLKKKHIAAYRINWDNKADNIISLSKELNLGLDSFVFADDNPTETEMIKNFIPEITILKVPSKLYLYPQILFKDGLFDNLSVTDEDKKRTEMYVTEGKRKAEETKFGEKNLEDFLKSLELTAHIHEAKESEVQRIAQLTQKTNQFNLTTKRYTEEQIKQFMTGDNTKVYTLTVKDKFGELGLTGVLIAEKKNDSVNIDSLLLSCRILGRNLESVFVNYCIKDLINTFKVSQFNSEYIPSKKNIQTAMFWDRHNFVLNGENAGRKSYVLKTDKFIYNPIPYITIIES